MSSPKIKTTRIATRLDLRRLILVLTICSALIPFANTFYAGYLVQRQQLIDTTLEGHYAYATKLARSTDDFLQSALQQLDYSAKLMAGHMDDLHYLGEEAARLRLQTKSFNSVTVIDQTGYVLATSPRPCRSWARHSRVPVSPKPCRPRGRSSASPIWR